MPTTPAVDPKELPSMPELHRATAGAVLLAAVLILTAVLPAERGIDPTGVGGWLGLTAMGQLKAGAGGHGEVATVDVGPQIPAAAGSRSDQLQLTLDPGQGAEIKAVMRKGDTLVYSWTGDRGELFFDFHGEPKGAAADVFTSFEKGTKSAAEGEFEAPFEGVHGWYWKNKAAVAVTVDLRTRGTYQSIGRK